MSEPLRFKLTKKQREVYIEDDPYMLCELDGLGRSKFMNLLSKRVEMGSDGQPKGVKSFDGIETGLLADSLFKVGDGDELIPVEKKTIEGWPSGMVTELFNAAMELSELNPKKKGAEDEEKND